MIYKRYVKGKGKFTKHNPLGSPIGQEVKNCDKNSKKKKMVMINTKKWRKKKKTMTIKIQFCTDVVKETKKLRS